MQKNKSGFSITQIKIFVERIRKEFGDGWVLLVPRVQRAIVAEAALFACGGQDAETIKTDRLVSLYHEMLEWMGMEESY